MLDVSHIGGLALKPIILVFGPSGVGKSYLSKKLAKRKFLYVAIDTDRKERTFAANGFPSNWDEDYHKVDVGHLVRVLGDRLGGEHEGGVISFPTVYVFTPENLAKAAKLGVTPVLLWGRPEDCERAAEGRINKKGKPFNRPRYKEKNKDAFQAYGCPEYGTFRVEAFREDGSRYPDDELLARIMARVQMTNSCAQTDAAEPHS
jgi:hypothetical protein